VREIGVRELKATLSDVLRHVARGERVRVTVRSRAVADIVPVGTAGPDERMQELIAQGRLVPPTRPRPERAPRLARAKTSASALVLAERDDER
jgi:prevent-host-death family protein